MKYIFLFFLIYIYTAHGADVSIRYQWKVFHPKEKKIEKKNKNSEIELNIQKIDRYGYIIQNVDMLKRTNTM